MWRKILFLALFTMIGGFCLALTVHLIDGTEIEGDITAKDNTNYYIDNLFGRTKVPISDVRVIYDDSVDVTEEYYNKSGFGKGGGVDIYELPLSDRIKQSPLGNNAGMSNYEIQMLYQIEKLNKNTARISTSMLAIWGVTIGISILATLMISN